MAELVRGRNRKGRQLDVGFLLEREKFTDVGAVAMHPAPPTDNYFEDDFQ